tara:strand:+ start:1367 stop:2794 length:1428 start_codon:yes stop_codon:yes gene_type:complete
MTSTIKVDNIQKVSDGSNIIKKCGSTITLGSSGQSVALASGATQTGFGRTGTVDWQTTKKTTAFTAANGEGYFVDTAASGAVTMTLPSSPSAGNIVAVKDYNGNFASANLTIGRGGSPINGGTDEDVVISTAGASIVLVYVDATQGWVATQDDASTFAGESFICASVSGSCNTLVTCGTCKIATFKGPGNFTVNSIAGCAANNLVSYIVVAGGGGGSCDVGGGGGAGGFRETKSPVTPYTASPLCGHGTPTNRITVTAATFPITVGGGGAGKSYPPTPQVPGDAGGTSSFSTISSAGGGGGAGASTGTGIAGGSGGGGYRGGNAGGAGNTPSVTPSQGNPGGTSGPSAGSSGGGGGAGAAGGNGAADCSPASNTGGVGVGTGINPSTCVGTPGPSAGRFFAGGGGGGARSQPSNSTPGGAGGAGGGGNGKGGVPQPASACNAAENTGGGGGGTQNAPGAGGNGGSGIVIIRYKSG